MIVKPDADPDHLRTIDAEYIYLEHGKIEIGTEDEPYTSKLEITMHGTIESAEIPDYGNKVTAVRHGGTLDIHGADRNVVWTSLARTADAETNIIYLDYDSSVAENNVDWVQGEHIVIASTSFYASEAEE